jgi:hypothetical protein
MVNLHLPEYLDAVGMRLRVDDFVMLRTKDDLILVTAPLLRTQGKLASRAFPAVSNYVRHLCDNGALLEI